MTAAAALQRLIGRSPDDLSLEERREVSGSWIALELYTPASLPLRMIEAIGPSAADCLRQLKARGRDPREHEFVLLDPPY